MSDPRAAALAEALSAAAHADGVHLWCKDRNDCGLYGYAEDLAAAILVALHGWTLVPVGTAAADIQRDYERHRRIEEVARKIARDHADGFDIAIRDLDALRAALEEKS